MEGLWKIIRHEGPSVLWHGVNVSVLISVPMICMYLPMYDNLMAEFDSSSTYAPLLAGSAARGLAVVATSPLELLKTRIQAAGATTQSLGKQAAGTSALSTALQQMRSDLKVCRAAYKCMTELSLLPCTFCSALQCQAPFSLQTSAVVMCVQCVIIA